MRLVSTAADAQAKHAKRDASAVALHDEREPNAQALHDTLVERGYIHYHSVLAERLSSFKAALMLGHAMYWTRYWLQREPHRGGWFYMTVREWKQSIGLSPTEQETARKLLVASGVWHERWIGSPARWHYRLDLQGLFTLMGEPGEREVPTPGNWQGLARLLGSPVLYFKPLGDMVGSAAAGLMLSHLLGVMRRAYIKNEIDASGFFRNESAQIALGLTEKVQRNARSLLIDAGFLQQKWAQEKAPKLLVRVNLTAVMACLSGQPAPSRRRGRASEQITKQPRLEVTPVQQSLLTKPGNQPESVAVARVERLVTSSTVVRPLAPVQPTLPTSPEAKTLIEDAPTARLRPQRLVDVPDARVALSPMLTAKDRPFIDLRVALSPSLYIQNPISEPTTTQDPPSSSSGSTLAIAQRDLDGFPSPATGGAAHIPAPKKQPRPTSGEGTSGAADLVMPKLLDPSLHPGARHVVAAVPMEHRQLLLDELEGKLRSSQLRSPLGWLHGLASKVASGAEVVYAMAASVAAERAALRSHEERLARALRGDPAVHPAAIESKPAGDISAFKASLARTKEAVLARRGTVSPDAANNSESGEVSC